MSLHSYIHLQHFPTLPRNITSHHRATAKQVDKGIGGKDNPDYNALPVGANNHDHAGKNTGGKSGNGKAKKKGQGGGKENKKGGAVSGNARAFISNISPYELTLPDLLHGKKKAQAMAQAARQRAEEVKREEELRVKQSPSSQQPPQINTTDASKEKAKPHATTMSVTAGATTNTPFSSSTGLSPSASPSASRGASPVPSALDPFANTAHKSNHSRHHQPTSTHTSHSHSPDTSRGPSPSPSLR